MIKRIVLMCAVSTLIYPVHGNTRQQSSQGSWVTPVVITMAVAGVAYGVYKGISAWFSKGSKQVETKKPSSLALITPNVQSVVQSQPTAKKLSTLERLKAAGIAQPTVMTAAQYKKPAEKRS